MAEKNQDQSILSNVLGAFSVDVIKWEPKTDEEASVVVHKFEAEDFPTGSQLIVHPSQMAVFVNNLTAGNSLVEDEAGKTQVAVFIGPCRIKLETGDSRFAPFRRVSQALTGDQSSYHSSVYFINTTYMNDLSWGTQAPVLVVDPEEEINVHVRAFGMFGAHIEQLDTAKAAIQASRFLRKVSGTRGDYTREQLVAFMRAKILEFVPDLLAKSVIEQQISVLKISAHLSSFSEALKQQLGPHFDEFGLTLDHFSFHSINVPDQDLQAINEMKIQRKRDRLEAEGTAARMDIESAARARMREREGFTYQQESSFDVLRTAAANEGSAGSLMGAGMGLGMGVGVGGAFGAGLTGAAQNLTGSQQAPAAQGGTVPCQKCQAPMNRDARFCPQCGEKRQNDETVCPDCGTPAKKGARFCYHCGKKLANTCPSCGAAIDHKGAFCSECGHKL